jgi:hypothetical protein
MNLDGGRERLNNSRCLGADDFGFPLHKAKYRYLVDNLETKPDTNDFIAKATNHRHAL